MYSVCLWVACVDTPGCLGYSNLNNWKVEAGGPEFTVIFSRERESKTKRGYMRICLSNNKKQKQKNLKH